MSLFNYQTIGGLSHTKSLYKSTTIPYNVMFTTGHIYQQDRLCPATKKDEIYGSIISRPSHIMACPIQVLFTYRITTIKYCILG